MSACCNGNADRNGSARGRAVRQFSAWVLPSTILVLVPKCPACILAYVALWTGLGLSLTAAAYLRWALLVLCVASLFLLIARRLHRMGNFGYLKKETNQCNTTS